MKQTLIFQDLDFQKWRCRLNGRMCVKHNLKKSKSIKELREYLNILDFVGATQAESLTVFRDLFHDPSSGAQPKCTTAVWWGKILMKMTMALNCPIFTITATSMSSIMGRNPILKENTNFDTLKLCAKKYRKFRF